MALGTARSEQNTDLFLFGISGKKESGKLEGG